jgi:putative FmdB family regulatory protein
MATYDHHCLPCGITVEVHLPISQRDTAQQCTQCGQVMRRVCNGHAVIRVPRPRTR